MLLAFYHQRFMIVFKHTYSSVLQSVYIAINIGRYKSSTFPLLCSSLYGLQILRTLGCSVSHIKLYQRPDPSSYIFSS